MESTGISPENCPTPEYHDTHRYCPSCDWDESMDKDELARMAKVFREVVAADRYTPEHGVNHRDPRDFAGG